MDWLKLPPLSALRAFSALAETGSAVAAGAKLNVSHAAISQQVRALEAHMNVALVDRSGRRLTLTAQGQELADALQLGFEAIARSIDTLTGADAERAVQVSTSQMFAVGWLMPRLQRFQSSHPDINLLINPTPELVELVPGGIDIALRFGKGSWPGLEAELLVPSDNVVAAAPALVGDAQFSDPSDLLHFPWLLELGIGTVPDWLRQHGLPQERLRSIEIPGNLILEGARRGQGVIIASYANLQPDIEEGRLRELFRDAGETGYYIVTRPGVLRPSARAFVAWLKAEARQAAAAK